MSGVLINKFDVDMLNARDKQITNMVYLCSHFGLNGIVARNRGKTR